MNLQKRIAFIMNNNFPASVKRKHMIYLIQHLDYYSEDANELGEAHATICEALEQLDNERDEQRAIERFTQSHFGKLPTKPLTVTELDNTLEFFLTYNILSMQQVQDIRAKAAAYLR